MYNYHMKISPRAVNLWINHGGKLQAVVLAMILPVTLLAHNMGSKGVSPGDETAFKFQALTAEEEKLYRILVNQALDQGDTLDEALKKSFEKFRALRREQIQAMSQK